MIRMLAAAAAAAVTAAATAAPLDEGRLRLFLDEATAATAGRVEVSIGEIDPRLALAPCARVEPFVPPGARLWGRTNLGVRCMEGAAWQAYIPVTVRVYAPALVAARPLAAGEPLTDADVQIAEVELTREAPGVLTDPARLQGKVLGRNVAAGQALRADFLRAKPVLGAGEQVRVVYLGDGFQVSTEGKSLGPAGDGQPVRVQTAAGRVLTGVARADRTVEVRF
jgi:flagella basal body P-ring formation protein FlgA